MCSYPLPELYLWELDPGDLGLEQPAGYSVSESAAAEVKAQKRRAETVRMRAEIDELNARTREQALDHEVPATVRAHRQVYGRDLRGWAPSVNCKVPWRSDKGSNGSGWRASRPRSADARRAALRRADAPVQSTCGAPPHAAVRVALL